jgi:hypothetical protein
MASPRPGWPTNRSTGTADEGEADQEEELREAEEEDRRGRTTLPDSPKRPRPLTDRLPAPIDSEYSGSITKIHATKNLEAESRAERRRLKLN